MERERPPSFECPGCGYDAAGLAALKCPECGVVFGDLVQWERTHWARATAWAALGLVALAVQVSVILSCGATGAGEPFRDMADYFWSIVKFAVIVGFFVHVPVFVVLVAVHTTARTRRHVMAAQVFACCVLACIPVSLFHGACEALAYTQMPGFSFWGGARSSWGSAPVVRWFSSFTKCLPMYAVVIAVVVMVTRRTGSIGDVTKSLQSTD